MIPWYVKHNFTVLESSQSPFSDVTTCTCTTALASTLLKYVTSCVVLVWLQ